MPSKGLSTFIYSCPFTKKLVTKPTKPPIKSVLKNMFTSFRLFTAILLIPMDYTISHFTTKAYFFLLYCAYYSPHFYILKIVREDHRMIRKYLAIIGIITLILAGCGNDTTARQDADYDQTKNMVVDILQTDDGKKALQEIIADDKMKQHLVMESDIVKKSITDALVSDQGTQMWQKLFEDPSFVDSFNKSIAEEQKKLFKSLMNDSEFQKQMLELMQNPEIDRKSTRLNSSHVSISYAVFCLKK